MPDKQTYNITPALRFPDFLNDGEWEVKRLGEIAELTAGATPLTTKIEYWENGSIPWMSSGEVHNGQIFDTEKRITQIGYDNCSTKLVPANSVVVALAGQGKTRGTVAITRIELCTNQSLCSILPNESFNSDFLYFYLSSKYEVLRQISSGDGTRGGLNLQMLRDFPIPLPPLPEQRRIAQALTALDELIAATNEKLEQVKAYKKGLMQKLFPAKGKKLPEFRFKEFEKDGEWKEVPFGSIIKECKDVSRVENEDVLLSSAIEGVFLNSEIFSHQRGSSNIGYRKLRKNMLILSAQNLHLGNANVNLRFEHGLISPAYKIYDISCMPEFLYHWVKKDSTKDFFYDATIEGASVCRRNVIWDKLYEQSFSIPSIPEQHKIANCLSTMDDQINAYTEKVSLLVQYKKGLMQQMFPTSK